MKRVVWISFWIHNNQLFDFCDCSQIYSFFIERSLHDVEEIAFSYKATLWFVSFSVRLIFIVYTIKRFYPSISVFSNLWPAALPSINYKCRKPYNYFNLRAFNVNNAH